MKLSEITFKPSVNFVIEVVDVGPSLRKYILRTMQGQIIDSFPCSKELSAFLRTLEFSSAPEVKL